VPNKIELSKPKPLLVGFQASLSPATATVTSSQMSDSSSNAELLWTPEQTVPEYIESIREKDIATLKGYAQKAHTLGQTKINRAIHTLIREKEASGSDEAFEAFVKRLAETTEERRKAGPQIQEQLQSETDRTNAQKESYEKRTIRDILSSKDPIPADRKRDLIVCWEQLQKRKMYMSENKDTSHAILTEMKDMLQEHSQKTTKYEKAAQVNEIFAYILSSAEHMVAFHQKYRDTLLAKHAELTKELQDSTDIKLTTNEEQMKAFIREKVITSPYFIPSKWQISLDGHPDATCQDDGQDISSYFGSYRFPGNTSFATAIIWYEGIRAEELKK
jgi:hypothetical protein